MFYFLQPPAPRHCERSVAIQSPSSRHCEQSEAIQSPSPRHCERSVAIQSPAPRHCERSVAIQTLPSPSGKKQKSLIASDRLFCPKSRPITLQRQTFHLLFKSLLPHLLAHLLRSTSQAALYATSRHRWCL